MRVLLCVSLLVCQLCMTANGNYAKFSALYEYWKPLCGDTPSNNIILSSTRYESISPDQRPWSLSSPTIHNAFKGKEGLKVCNSTKELVQSISNKVSDFTCSLQWIGIDEICKIMSVYARFYFIGDSQLRQMMQALYMIFNNDFRHGAYPRLANKPIPYGECSCDGQFSDHIKCRDYASHFNIKDLRNMGAVCTHAEGYHPFEMTIDLSDGVLPWSIYEICTDDYRPRFIYLHGGTVYDTDSYYYYRNYLKPSLTSINFDMQICPWRSRWYIIWSGVPSSSPGLAAKQPSMSDASTARFNADIEAHLKADFPTVMILNFWNITQELSSQKGGTADGFHQLSDGNLLKAMILLNMAKMVAQEYPGKP